MQACTFPRPLVHSSARPFLFLLAVSLLLAGCLPSSCRREESRALFPSDSLSRQVAEATAVDTLQLAWRTTGTETHPLEYPRTLLFGERGRLYASDVERNSLFVFGEDGRFVEEMVAEAFDVPYLVGRRGDTLVVFNPREQRLDFWAGGRIASSRPTPQDLPRAPLQFVAASDDAVFFKLLGEDFEGYVARLDADGNLTKRVALPGPSWRHAGMLRLWGDTLVSLSGYRAVADLFPTDLSALPDTLALVGFDSPMLARSRSFALGNVGEPPLLSPAAAPAGAFLFALNMRPGWLQIDVFDRQGRLVRRLTQPDPSFGQNFYPRDLAVRHRPDGAYELAVALTDPAPRVDLYVWKEVP